MVQTRRRPVAPGRKSAPSRPSSTDDGGPGKYRSPGDGRPVMAAPGLAGFAVLVVVSGNLGLPLPGGYLAIDVLLVAIGFDLARVPIRPRDQPRKTAAG